MNNFKKVVCEMGLFFGSYFCGFFDASSAPHWCWVVAFIMVLASTFFLTTFMMWDGDGDGE